MPPGAALASIKLVVLAFTGPSGLKFMPSGDRSILNADSLFDWSIHCTAYSAAVIRCPAPSIVTPLAATLRQLLAVVVRSFVSRTLCTTLPQLLIGSGVLLVWACTVRPTKNKPTRDVARTRVGRNFMWIRLSKNRTDRHVPIRYTLRTAAAIRRCAVQIYHSVGHAPFIEVPEEFTELLEEFVLDDLTR